MAKPKNSVKSVKITLSTTPQVQAYLEQLVRKGLHGKNPAEAAERLVAVKLEELLSDNSLQPVRPEEMEGWHDAPEENAI